MNNGDIASAENSSLSVALSSLESKLFDLESRVSDIYTDLNMESNQYSNHRHPLLSQIDGRLQELDRQVGITNPGSSGPDGLINNMQTEIAQLRMSIPKPGADSYVFQIGDVVEMVQHLGGHKYFQSWTIEHTVFSAGEGEYDFIGRPVKLFGHDSQVDSACLRLVTSFVPPEPVDNTAEIDIF